MTEVLPFTSPEDIPDELLDDPEFLGMVDGFDRAYWSFKPRPDQPERYDQQTAFLNSKTKGVKILLGGNGAGTTTTCVRALCQFVMTTPPPRKDCPIWVIGPDLAITMKTVWKEKMMGLGHLPEEEVEHDRIIWWQPRAQLPFSVPLKEWPSHPGKNWTIHFRGWQQGRISFQAEAIGGFLFLEQFPFEILTEVLRGCREYDYPCKLIEFTPVDPNIGTELLDMIDDNSLPKGWEVYYLNTMCAAEAGNVQMSWFEEFFSTVPETMRETRMTGRLPKWEGIIYSQFNRAIHLVEDDVIDHPKGVYHFRTIDWGAGPENPFGCLWGYKNALGQYFIYDEYKSNDEKTVTDHLAEVANRWPWPEGNPLYGTTYGDPSGLAFFRIAARLSEYCPGTNKIHMTAASNDVIPGIEYVQYLLQVDPKLATPDFPDGQPRLFIHKDNCPELAKEFTRYKWQKGVKSGANPKDAKTAPVKKDDHLLDALRYGTFTQRQLTIAQATATSARDEDVNAAARHGVRHQRKSAPHLFGRKAG